MMKRFETVTKLSLHLALIDSNNCLLVPLGYDLFILFNYVIVLFDYVFVLFDYLLDLFDY